MLTLQSGPIAFFPFLLFDFTFPSNGSWFWWVLTDDKEPTLGSIPAKTFLGVGQNSSVCWSVINDLAWSTAFLLAFKLWSTWEYWHEGFTEEQFFLFGKLNHCLRVGLHQIFLLLIAFQRLGWGLCTKTTMQFPFATQSCLEREEHN